MKFDRLPIPTTKFPQFDPIEAENVLAPFIAPKKEFYGKLDSDWFFEWHYSFLYQFNNISLFNKYYIEVLSTQLLHYLPGAK